MLAKCVFDKHFISCEDVVKRFAHCHYSDHVQRCISTYLSDHGNVSTVVTIVT